MKRRSIAILVTLTGLLVADSLHSQRRGRGRRGQQRQAPLPNPSQRRRWRTGWSSLAGTFTSAPDR